MSHPTTTLTLPNVAAIKPVSGIYALQHVKSGKLFFGSSLHLRARLKLWFYDLKGNAERLPPKVRELIEAQGRNAFDEPDHEPYHWSFKIMTDGLPTDYSAHKPITFKPEWPFIEMAKARVPELLLNSLPTDGMVKPPPQVGPRGTSPMRFLGGRLGKSNYRYRKGQPEHSWPIDPRVLPTEATLVGSPLVRFAEFLHRGMRALKPASMNPSPAVIQQHYRHWLRWVPDGSPARLEHEPGTINEALAVPLPDGYVS